MKYFLRLCPLWMMLLLFSACASAPEKAATASDAEKNAPVRAQLQVSWVVDVDQRRPMSPPGVSSPVLAGNLIVIGARDRRVRVYDLHGNEIRRIALEAACESGALALHPHLVVLGDVTGTLYGIDPRSGRIVWRQRLSSVMLGHPVRNGNDFFVQTADNQIYRFSAGGKKRWSFTGQTSGGLSMHHGPSPLVSNNHVFAVFNNGDVVALKADSGDLIWRRQLLLNTNAVVLSQMKAPMADPVLVGNHLIVAFYQGNMLALSARDGQQIWRRQLSLRSTPLVRGNHLVVATASGTVTEIDTSTGTTLWRQKLEAGEMAGPVLLQGRLVAADSQGHVYELTVNGHRAAEVDLPGRVDRAPVAVSGGVLIRNNLGGLYLIR